MLTVAHFTSIAFLTVWHVPAHQFSWKLSSILTSFWRDHDHWPAILVWFSSRESHLFPGHPGNVPGSSMFDPWLILDLSRMDLGDAGPHPRPHPGPYPGLLTCIQEHSWIAL